jgi:hypothetical protein
LFGQCMNKHIEAVFVVDGDKGRFNRFHGRLFNAAKVQPKTGILNICA